MSSVGLDVRLPKEEHRAVTDLADPSMELLLVDSGYYYFYHVPSNLPTTVPVDLAGQISIDRRHHYRCSLARRMYVDCNAFTLSH